MFPCLRIHQIKRYYLLLLLSLFFFGASRSIRAQDEEPQTEWRFGVVEAYTARNAARELGIGWTRVRFQWAYVQGGGPDTWTPEVTDEQIDEQLAAGREVVGLLIGIPEWARDEQKLPSGLWLDHHDPGNQWANFVREISDRYAGRIDHWIIWNEPDIDASEVAHSWDGSVEDFYQLQRVAYLVAKESNPQAVVHLGAFTYWADVEAEREQYMARLLDRILADPEAAQHNFYFDVATAHLYFQPDQIYELLGIFRAILAERGLAQPIWLVETNAPPYDDPDWPVDDPTLPVTSTEQAAFMPQAVAAALAGGAERVSIYKLRDTEGDRAANPEPFGLLRLDGSRRVATNTLREAYRLMRGTQSATRERWDAIGQFRLEQSDRITTVLFARLPTAQEVEVEAIASSALLVDMWGQIQLVTAEDGRYRLTLQQALCTQTIGDYCMIGGTPLYLIQARDGGPPPDGAPPVLPPALVTPAPLPTLLPSPSLTPSPSTTGTATVSSTPLPTATPRPTSTPTAGGEQATEVAGAVSTPSRVPAVPSTPPPAEDAQEDVWLFAVLLGSAGLGLLALILWGMRQRRAR